MGEPTPKGYAPSPPGQGHPFGRLGEECSARSSQAAPFSPKPGGLLHLSLRLTGVGGAFPMRVRTWQRTSRSKRGKGKGALGMPRPRKSRPAEPPEGVRPAGKTDRREGQLLNRLLKRRSCILADLHQHRFPSAPSAPSPAPGTTATSPSRWPPSSTRPAGSTAPSCASSNQGFGPGVQHLGAREPSDGPNRRSDPAFEDDHREVVGARPAGLDAGVALDQQAGHLIERLATPPDEVRQEFVEP